MNILELKIIKNKYFIFFINSFLTIFLIKISPSFYGDSLIDFDSPSYINESPYRFSIYPYIINFIGKDQLEKLITLQIVILSISFSFISFAMLQTKIKKSLIILLQVFLIFNFFYTSFSKVILTESLFFSSINLILGCLIFFFVKRQNYLLFIASLLSGFLVSLRPEGIVLGLTFLIIILFLKNQKNYFSSFVLIFLIFPLSENIIYFKKFEERKTVFNQSILGKFFMLSGTQNFNINDYSELSDDFLIQTVRQSQELHSFLQKIKNPYLKSNLISDFEVFGQYELKKILDIDDFQFNENIKKLDFNFFLKLILKNPVEYLHLSFHHYVTMWTPGGRIFLLEKELKKKNLNLPFSDLQTGTSGNLKLEKINKLFFFITVSFSFVMIFLIIFFIFSIFQILKGKEELIYFFTLGIQFHLISVSITNIGSFRYLMPTYPLILIVLIILIDKLRLLK